MNALLLALALSVSTATPAPVAKKMTCSAPQALQNDAVQTVRICEFK